MLTDELDTPCVVIDLDAMEQNLRRCQAYLDGHGVALRPHIKTHKIPAFAQRQLALGAKGITCQKLGEAEVMADAGITDILISYNIVGRQKLDRLVALARRAAIMVVADSADVVEGLADAMSRAGFTLPVLVECDTGGHRCGVAVPRGAADLAAKIDQAAGLEFGGLMCYPVKGDVEATGHWLAEAIEACSRIGLTPPGVSSGGSPDLYRAHEVTAATEHRPGTYIYSDRSLVAHGHGTFENCALRVHATVVSHAALDRWVIDAGSKSLSSDLLGLTGHGHIVEHPQLTIGKLTEEHGHVHLPAGAALSNDLPRIGDRVTVIPNHACVVSNLHDRVYVARAGRVEGFYDVAARGKSR